MRKVVKKEVLRLLHAAIIYHVQDSELVSLVQVTTRREHSPLREVQPYLRGQSSRTCIDYRMLTKATLEDHFPFPFFDKLLERLSNHSFFLYHDG